jgi:hypothetical protein
METKVERLNDGTWQYTVFVRACTTHGFRESEHAAQKAAKEDESLLRMFCQRVEREAR